MAVTERVLLAGIGLLLLTAPPAATALDPSAGSPREDTAELAPLSGPLQVVRDEERDALEALALYQEPLRTAILEVSRHPQALVGLERIQTRTRQAFLTRIETLPETTQDQVWELVRFPSLVSALAAAEDRSSAELEALARGYPQEARAAATRLGAERHELVRALAQLQSGFETDFEALVRGLPATGEAGFRALLEHPEALDLLTQHAHLSLVLGEAYARDPQGLEQALSTLANEVAARSASARDEWVHELEADPEAQEDLERAGQAYAEAEGFDYASDTGVAVEAHTTLVVQPYPYWFGYPFAYIGFSFGFYPYAWWWYPPHHHYFGFYYGPRRRVVVVGYPSPHFAHWMFGFDAHRDAYPHLSKHFARHSGFRRYARDGFAHHAEAKQRPRRVRDRALWGGGSRAERGGPDARVGRGERRSLVRQLGLAPKRDAETRRLRAPQRSSVDRRVRESPEPPSARARPRVPEQHPRAPAQQVRKRSAGAPPRLRAERAPRRGPERNLRPSAAAPPRARAAPAGRTARRSAAPSASPARAPRVETSRGRATLHRSPRAGAGVGERRILSGDHRIHSSPQGKRHLDGNQ